MSKGCFAVEKTLFLVIICDVFYCNKLIFFCFKNFFFFFFFFLLHAKYSLFHFIKNNLKHETENTKTILYSMHVTSCSSQITSQNFDELTFVRRIEKFQRRKTLFFKKRKTEKSFVLFYFEFFFLLLAIPCSSNITSQNFEPTW